MGGLLKVSLLDDSHGFIVALFDEWLETVKRDGQMSQDCFISSARFFSDVSIGECYVESYQWIGPRPRTTQHHMAL